MASSFSSSSKSQGHDVSTDVIHLPSLSTTGVCSALKGDHSIGSLQFSILSADMIRKLSVMRDGLTPTGITEPTTFENNAPKRNGLCDLRMGTTEKQFQCETCLANMIECPGHSGHIELATACYHPGFMRHIKHILNCVCFYCSRLLLSESNAKYARLSERRPHENRYQRLRRAITICGNTKQCPHCHVRQPKITLESQMVWLGVTFNFSDKKPSDYYFVLLPEKAQEILSHISDRDCMLLGLDATYARPEWMIVNALHVPAPCIRPSIKTDSARGEDDVTHKLIDVVKVNQHLHGLLQTHYDPHQTPRLTYRDLLEWNQKLQFHVSLVFDNAAYGKMHSTYNNRPIKTIKLRLTGKDGRFRANLNGKRVNFSARNVISPEPNADIDELGIPQVMAQLLTYPVRVTRYNIAHLQKLVQRGPNTYPGARFVHKHESGDLLDLRYIRDARRVNLVYGDVVDRHLIKGDVVLFNRQPSLHRMSMMAHKIFMLPTNTFAFSLSVTRPYNADFDGDEMNLHVPQGEEARAEALELMLVPNQIVSPQNNKPIITPVQDELLGIAFFTHRDVFLTQAQAQQLFMQITTYLPPHHRGTMPMPAILKPTPLWTGKQLVSCLLPDDVMMTRESNNFNANVDNVDAPPADTKVHVRGGELMTGNLCKCTIGNTSGSLVHLMFNDYSPSNAKRFIDGITRLANHWLSFQGYSIRYSDTVLPSALDKKVTHLVKKCNTQVQHLESQAKREHWDRERLEQEINFVTNRMVNQEGVILKKHLSKDNNILRMILTGSKGSFLNVSQIMMGLGQQNIEGKRVPLEYGGDRSLPHQPPNSHLLLYRGHVEHSFTQGLSPVEFFFHAKGGREGLVDTAIKTSSTGYVERKIIKSMEDVSVMPDYTVRNSRMEIVQFLYGEDMMDATLLEWHNAPMATDSVQHFQKRFLWSVAKLRVLCKTLAWDRDTLRREKKAVQVERSLLIKARACMQDVLVARDDTRYVAPIPLARLAQRISYKHNHTPTPPLINKHDLLTPRQVVVAVLQFERKLHTVLRLCESSKKLLMAHMWQHVCSRRCIYEYAWTPQCLSLFLETAFSHLQRTIVAPGEMVGPLAAQSVSEPSTQMTLNTFHYTGISSKNQTSGIPRLKELTEVLHKTKTPSLRLVLRDGPAWYAKDQKASSARNAKARMNRDGYCRATALARSLVICTFSEVVHAWQPGHTPQMLHDPNAPQGESLIENDKEAVWWYYQMPEENVSLHHSSFVHMPYCLRLKLRRDVLIDKQLTMADVAHAIRKHLEKHTTTLNHMQFLVVRCDDDHDGDLFVRIRPVFYVDAPPPPTRTQARASGKRKRAKRASKAKPPAANKHMNMWGKRQCHHVLFQVLEVLSSSTFYVRGIPGIRTADVREVTKMKRCDSHKGKHTVIKKHPEYLIDTLGSNLAAAFELDDVDAARSFSNEILETCNVLGIEACRYVLRKEIKTVLNFVYINYRHIALLCDVMTHRGFLMSITRFGINRVSCGPLRKAAFEETYRMLINAATLAERDDISGISEMIMTGNRINIGTGAVQFDLTDAYRQHIKDAQPHHTHANKNLQTLLQAYESRLKDVAANKKNTNDDKSPMSPAMHALSVDEAWSDDDDNMLSEEESDFDNNHDAHHDGEHMRFLDESEDEVSSFDDLTQSQSSDNEFAF